MTIKSEDNIKKKQKRFSKYTIYTSFFMFTVIIATILDYSFESFIVPVWFIVSLQLLVIPMVIYIMNTEHNDMHIVPAFTPIVVITIFTILLGFHRDELVLKLKVDTIAKTHPIIMALNGHYPSILNNVEVRNYKLLLLNEEYYIEWHETKYPLKYFSIDHYKEIK